MHKITKPVIGGKASTATTSRADTAEYFKSKYSSYETKPNYKQY